MRIFGIIDIYDRYSFFIVNDTGDSVKVELCKESFISDLTRVMTQRGITFNALDYIAVCVDYTSYTGMRILYAFCVGLSLTTNMRVVDISSLDIKISSSDSIRNAALQMIKAKKFVDIYHLHLNYI